MFLIKIDALKLNQLESFIIERKYLGYRKKAVEM